MNLILKKNLKWRKIWHNIQQVKYKLNILLLDVLNMFVFYWKYEDIASIENFKFMHWAIVSRSLQEQCSCMHYCMYHCMEVKMYVIKEIVILYNYETCSNKVYFSFLYPCHKTTICESLTSWVFKHACDRTQAQL